MRAEREDSYPPTVPKQDPLRFTGVLLHFSLKCISSLLLKDKTRAHSRTQAAQEEMCPVPTDGQQKLWQKGGIKKQQGMRCDENVRLKPAGYVL